MVISRLEYGKEYVVSSPRVGLWSKKVQHKHRRSSRRSVRAAFADRFTLPESAILMLDRPPIMPELSDAELRARIRGALEVREEEVAQERAGKPVLGMKAALKIHWSTVPRDGEELFPAGTVRMRLRHKVGTEPIPGWLRAA